MRVALNGVLARLLREVLEERQHLSPAQTTKEEEEVRRKRLRGGGGGVERGAQGISSFSCGAHASWSRR